MLVLCSNGLSSEALINALRERTAGLSRAALVVTADREYKKEDYHVPRCTEELSRLGLSVDLLDIDEDDPQELLNYDAVEFIGGNPFYLLTAIRRTGAEPVLKTLAREKLLIGWSAAAFVFSPTLALVNEYSPELNTDGLVDLSALALTNIEVLPHYGRFLKRFDRFEERCAAYERERGKSVLRLNDGDGVIIDGNAPTIIRA